MSVDEYSRTFNTLAQYASTDADTDAKKKRYFLKGLNPKLQAHLIQNNSGSFDDLVNSALLMEDVVGACVDEKTRKRTLQGSSSSAPKKYRMVTPLPAAPQP